MLRGFEDTTAFLARLDKEHRSIGENWELNRQAWERFGPDVRVLLFGSRIRDDWITIIPRLTVPIAATITRLYTYLASLGVTAFVRFAGLFLFHRTEQTFIDVA
jgi:hypothetical protein